jgi:2,3-dimethylmalate lyase
MAIHKSERLRELIAQDQLLVLPGAYDALSARIAQDCGFSAITAGGFAAIGSMLAQPDWGQSNLRDYAQHYGRIASSVDVPVYADADTGFGGVYNVQATVRAFEAAGLAGIFLSDQVFPNRCGYFEGKAVIAPQEMVAKLKAALDARQNKSFFICARTDAAAVEGDDAAIARCQLYMRVGADMAKPQGMDSTAQIQRAISEIPGPHFGTLSQAAGKAGLSLSQLHELGVKAVTLPSLLLFAAAHGVQSVLSQLAAAGEIAPVASELMSLNEYKRLVRLDEFQAREKAWSQAQP